MMTLTIVALAVMLACMFLMEAELARLSRRVKRLEGRGRP